MLKNLEQYELKQVTGGAVSNRLAGWVGVSSELTGLFDALSNLFDAVSATRR